jgi:ribulose-phosphate 3-epimerase
MNFQILPSLLAADMGNLEAGVRKAEASGADALHLDIMDGHFVPNISMGPAVVEMARRVTDMHLNVHLMLSRPDHYISSFVDAGADSIQIHIEAECDVSETLERLSDYGVRAGIVLNPETPVQLLYPALGIVDEVLFMSVHPGYGGQAFISDVLPKIRTVRERACETGKDKLSIMVDGGINRKTAVQCAEHGANAFVAGTFLYRADDMKAEIDAMRKAVSAAFKA